MGQILALTKLCHTYHLLTANKSARSMAHRLAWVLNLGWCQQYYIHDLFGLRFMITCTKEKQ